MCFCLVCRTGSFAKKSTKHSSSLESCSHVDSAFAHCHVHVMYIYTFLTGKFSFICSFSRPAVEDEVTGARAIITRALCASIPAPVAAATDAAAPPPPAQITVGFAPESIAALPPYAAQRVASTKFIASRSFDALLQRQPLSAPEMRDDPVLHRGYVGVCRVRCD